METFSDAALQLRFVSLIVGETFTTHTQFYQWPLYVAGFSDIHQSLEAGLARGDIETNNTDQTSNQEVRYTNTSTYKLICITVPDVPLIHAFSNLWLTIYRHTTN